MSPALALHASASFPPELNHSLEQITRQKKVSIAWVVRDAAEKYVAVELVMTADLSQGNGKIV